VVSIYSAGGGGRGGDGVARLEASERGKGGLEKVGRKPIIEFLYMVMIGSQRYGTIVSD
jgi:hypothetical protein